MVQQSASMIFVGIRGTVLALETSSGTEVWRTKLGGSHFVNVTVDGESIYASTHGEVFCLSAASGTIRWRNPLKGLGMGLVTIGLPGQNTVVAAKMQMDQDVAVASAVAGAAAASA